MIFEFMSVAEASVGTLMKSINRVIINPIIYFLFVLALAYFLYGIARYLLNPSNEEINKQSKTQMITGVAGLFIMVAVFGIMNLILGTVGEKRIKLDNTGNYVINNDKKDYEFNVAGDNTNPTETDLTIGMLDIRTGNSGFTVKSKKINFKTSPFRVKYLPNDLCWRSEVYVPAPTEYQSIKAVKKKAKDELSFIRIGFKTPLNYGILTAYDAENEVYYTWMDARYPKNGGDDRDCVLKVDTENTPELPLDDYVNGNPFTKLTNVSKGPSLFTDTYDSDALFTRVIASGANPILELAREIALKNAFLLLGIKIKGVNTMTNVYQTAAIFDEQYKLNEDTGNYEYWVAIRSKKYNGKSTNIVSNITKISPFTNKYESNQLFSKIIDYGSSKNLSEAKDLAIKNVLLKLSKEVIGSDKVQFVNILEEKQIFNEKTGKYEYWVAVSYSDSVDGSNIVYESTNPSPFTKTYETDSIYNRVVESGVSKNLSEARDIAIKNANIKLSKKVTGSDKIKFVNLLEEKQIFNEKTGNYEYWVAVETLK